MSSAWMVCWLLRPTVLARQRSSWSPTTETSELSLIIDTKSLPMAGHHDADRLRQDDPTHDQALRHAQRLGGLALALGTAWMPARKISVM